jgi:hypothetical protein
MKPSFNEGFILLTRTIDDGAFEISPSRLLVFTHEASRERR